ncbi:MAG: helix-turn-helix transcriptional regulator [Bacteroidales bacterium]|nr:helix-turn-helix transcriptional regulator [Bacteroidales bacterium]
MKRLFSRETVYACTDEEITAEIGNRLKALRLSSCVSQSEFAKMSGVSLSTVRRAESGRLSEVSFGHLLRILRAGGMLDGLADLVEEVPLHPALKRNAPKRIYASSKMRERYEHR